MQGFWWKKECLPWKRYRPFPVHQNLSFTFQARQKIASTEMSSHNLEGSRHLGYTEVQNMIPRKKFADRLMMKPISSVHGIAADRPSLAIRATDVGFGEFDHDNSNTGDFFCNTLSMIIEEMSDLDRVLSASGMVLLP